MTWILVATKETQGMRMNDLFTCNDGDLVHFSQLCDRDRGKDVEEMSCGCGYLMDSIDTGLTSTFAVVESPHGQGDKRTYARLYKALLLKYANAWKDTFRWGELEKMADEEASELLRIAKSFGKRGVTLNRGYSLEISSDNIRVRNAQFKS